MAKLEEPEKTTQVINIIIETYTLAAFLAQSVAIGSYTHHGYGGLKNQISLMENKLQELKDIFGFK